MIARDTLVHAVAVVAAVALLVAATYFELDTASGPAAIALFLAFYALVLGGAHGSLALRGEDGMIPVESRWRFLTMTAIVLATAAVVRFAGDRTIGPLALETVGAVVALGTAVAYFVAESVAGYRGSRST